MANPKHSWVIPLVAILSLFGIFTWQLGIFNMSQGSTTSTGFAKIKPQLAGVYAQSTGTFTSIFTNGAGTKIDIIGVSVSDLMRGKTCSALVSATQVTAGENFQVTSSDCVSGYSGDVYNIRVDIDYAVTIGGVRTQHKDSGTLRGPIDGYTSGGYSGWGYGSLIHRSFDFGGWWFFIAILSIVFVLESYGNVSRSTDSGLAQVLATYGFIFLLCSTLIFIFGVDHLANGRDDSTYPLRMRYGWMIEGAVYFVVGLALALGAHVSACKGDPTPKVIVYILGPLVTLLVLAVAVVYPMRALDFAGRLDSRGVGLGMGWIPEVFLLLFAIASCHAVITSVAKRAGMSATPAILSHARMIASLYFIISAGLFIWGVNTLVYSESLMYGRLVGSVLMAVGGGVLFASGSFAKKPEDKAKNEGGGGNSTTTVVILVAVFLFLLFFWQLGIF